MQKASAAQVLALIQAFDNRKTDQATITAWADILPDQDVNDYLDAVKDHYRTSSEWLMPAHLIRRVKSTRSRRIEVAGDPRLKTSDEYDDQGKRLPDADRKQRYLTALIASGSVSTETYRRYEAGVITLAQLGETSRTEPSQIDPH